jgi:hypothetical protein
LASPSGRYNCHGLVFASRRANVGLVGLEVDIDEVLRRDGFSPLGGEEKPRVGDVVAYRATTGSSRVHNEPAGEIEHTGFVCRVDGIGSTPVVWIWSAWGGLGEFEHQVKHCPYGGIPQFWRLR